jgi:creatinine amidohydrolase
MAVSNILGLGAEVKAQLAEQESGGHADEMETSCMLVIRPELVNMTLAVNETLAPLPSAYGTNGIQKFAVAGKMTTQSGINGDSTLATREKGEKILAAMTDDLVTFLAEFAQI